MKKDNLTLHILFVLSIILLAVGLLALTYITSGKADLATLWPWLFGLPIGGGGILYIASEYKQR